jgi:cytochrome P450
MPAAAAVPGRAEIDFSVYDPFAMDFLENPFPVLERMLNEFPVAFHRDINAWFVSPHELAAEVLRSPRFTARQAPAHVRTPVRGHAPPTECALG